jgi:hypothetical protein
VDRREIANGRGGHLYARLGRAGNRERRKERERQMRHGVAKFLAVRAVPGINGIEGLKRGDAGVFEHADQVEAGVGDGAGPVDAADQRENGARRPDFGIVRFRRFHLRQPEDHVADRTGTDQQPSMHASTGCGPIPARR